jgi:GNAT superfamily N-acetyltransferase
LIVRTAVAADMPRMLGAVGDFAAELHLGIDHEHVAGVLRDILLSGDGLLAVMESDDKRLTGVFAAVAHKHILSGETVCGEVLFYVAPAARGHGRKLLRYAETWAVERGCVAVMLGHFEATPMIEKAYRRWGYEPQERFYKKELW